MTPSVALGYSFLFGLLHGILPDEHTWPITFSYAIGTGSGKKGMMAALCFSAAFSFQRMILSELSYLALARFLLIGSINAYVYVAIGLAMSVAGSIVVRRNRYPHIHLLGHHHEQALSMERTSRLYRREHEREGSGVSAPPIYWTLAHGFLAGFGIGGFGLFVNTVAAPAMPSAWIAFLPGMLFGAGTTMMLLLIGGMFGLSLRWARSLTEMEIKRIGVQTGGRTLFFGGVLFVSAGIVLLFGWNRLVPIDMSYLLIGAFAITVVMPAFVFSWKEVLAARKRVSTQRAGISGMSR